MSTEYSAIAVSVMLLALAGAASAQQEQVSQRETIVSEGLAIDAGRAGKQAGKAESHTAEKPIASGQSDRSARKSATIMTANVNQNFWFYDARSALAEDFDGDGFYTRLELTFDADTAYEGANVYAVVYLSLEGGEWVEYGETAVFDIYGSSGNDEYYYDTDFVSGFPRGYYDVLIELYDDYDQRLVAVIGPSESPDLFDLPLESQATDDPLPPVVVITEERGGGSAGLWLIALLSTTLIGRLLFRRQRLAVTD